MDGCAWKFFSILWSCAQNEVLKNEYNIDPLLIIDDVKSELDERVFNLLLEILSNSKNQIIFSCIDNVFSRPHVEPKTIISKKTFAHL